MSAGNDAVRVMEVGPRDGLQNEKALLPPAVKIELVERLGACGLPASR
jgi:Isopropylmalate/homocitrate/citramalate synthases